MKKPTFDPAEARRRIAILTRLPQTPTRRRELAALERALEMAASAPPPTRSPRTARTARTAPGRAARLMEDAEEDEEPLPRPLREIERSRQGIKKIILRRTAPARPSLKDEGREDRERHERISDLGSLLGDHHRGMS